ncbi:MAG TPA: helix-turn-helix domain-containing protein [Pseudonocardiaceae bacterium]|jgi:hypothetical protein|nr:helix-turn-helix domain-containing protein [Pseudonocardiaceae bacterium]
MNVAAMRHVTSPVGQELAALLALSATMADSPRVDDVLLLVSCAVSAWSSCDVAAGYVLREGKLDRSPVGWLPITPAVDERVAELRGTDGPVRLAGRPWATAVALRGSRGTHGYLVVSARSVPCADELFLLRVLAQQAGIAVAGVALRHALREQTTRLGTLNSRLAAADERLATMAVEQEHQAAVRRALHTAPGEQAVADALHHLTGRPVTVEDPFGNVRCWAGPDLPERHARPDPPRYAETLRHAVRRGRPVRDGDRVLAVARPRHEILGAVALVGCRRGVGAPELYALEEAAIVLGKELAHRRGLAELESRLRGDLVDDLVTGGTRIRAYARAEAVGHDLHGPHQVLAVRWPDGGLPDAVSRATASLDIRCLLGSRSDMVVLVAHGPVPARDLYDRLDRDLGPGGAVGVGGLVDSPDELPRSFEQASHALGMARSAGVVVFDDLGLYRLLHAGRDGAEIERYVREWLGRLLDYDSRHHAELTNTLFHYLECGGNYAATAHALLIHRSTLRYRLRRIRDVGDVDLHDVNSRLNLHVAARAWHMLTAQG